MATGKADEGFISGYWSTIADKESKRRYADKLRLVNGSDPYGVPKKDWNDILDMWPGIMCVHACMYLIFNPSPYTKEDMLNYKSLDSYRDFQDGRVSPWVIVEDDGRILAAYCNCMAGLGETCSHVASHLWAVAAGVGKRESMTVTQKCAYWVLPPAIKAIQYSPIADIDFVGKKRKSASIGRDTVSQESGPSNKQAFPSHPPN